MKTITPSKLFNSTLYEDGIYKCFYCGLSCSNKYTSKEFVKDTFNNRDIVAYPSSNYVCGCCVATLQEKTTITLIDGEIRDRQRIRQYSWFITKDKAIPFTKSHINLIREKIINPPEPPFIFIFSDSGQKHLMFRSRIALDRENFTVMLEEQYIDVNLSELKETLNFLVKPISVFGKIAILEELTPSNVFELFERFPNEAKSIIYKLEKIKGNPLTKLAVWLSPNKEDCLKLTKEQQ